MDRDQIARVAHTVNRAYCQALGDDSLPEWDAAPDWQREGVLAGVDMHLANPDATPEDSHDAWLAAKLEAGWAYGAVKDVEAKLHPCVLPFAELPLEQRVKDHLSRAVVHACKGVEVKTEVKTQTVLVDGSRVPVKYIGSRPITDGAYGSYLTFTKGETLLVPPDLAAKLLRHPDQYAPGEAQGAALPEKQKHSREQSDEDRAQEVRDQLASMTKAGLMAFSEQNYRIKQPRDLAVADMRAAVVQLFEQYGV